MFMISYVDTSRHVKLLFILGLALLIYTHLLYQYSWNTGCVTMKTIWGFCYHNSRGIFLTISLL